MKLFNIFRIIIVLFVATMLVVCIPFMLPDIFKISESGFFSTDTVSWAYFSVGVIYSVFAVFSIFNFDKVKSLKLIVLVIYSISVIANLVVLVLNIFNRATNQLPLGIQPIMTSFIVITLILCVIEFVIFATMKIVKEQKSNVEYVQTTSNQFSQVSNELNGTEENGILNPSFGKGTSIDPSMFKTKLHQFKSALSKSYEEALQEVEKTGSIEGLDIGQLEEEQKQDNSMFEPEPIMAEQKVKPEVVEKIEEVQSIEKETIHEPKEEVDYLKQESGFEHKKANQPEMLIPKRLWKDPLHVATQTKDYEEISSTKLSEKDASFDYETNNKNKDI